LRNLRRAYWRQRGHFGRASTRLGWTAILFIAYRANARRTSMSRRCGGRPDHEQVQSNFYGSIRHEEVHDDSQEPEGVKLK